MQNSNFNPFSNTSTLRNRVKNTNEGEIKFESSSIAKGLKKMDLYPKTKEHVQTKTRLGGIVSIITGIVVFILFLTEFNLYLTHERTDRLGVDLQPHGYVDILFNITFPHIPCHDLHVDVIDMAGAQQINIGHRIHKTPVDENFNLIMPHSHRQIDLGATLHESYTPFSDRRSPFFCGSCYDANVPRGTCCNSCSDVLEAYKKSGYKEPDMSDIEQCGEVLSHKYVGCNMYGDLKVNKVAGNFHFAPGRSFQSEQHTSVAHVHEFNPWLVAQFNSSHIIHHMSFGVDIPYVKYPLDGKIKIMDSLAIHKYFIKVVPTIVERFFYSITSAQYSYTEFVQKIDLTKRIALPGIFFVYDLSPITITYQEGGRGFLHFLVKLCAIIGGVFAISKFIDNFIHKISKKIE
eukprot:gene6334-10341_t